MLREKRASTYINYNEFEEKVNPLIKNVLQLVQNAEADAKEKFSNPLYTEYDKIVSDYTFKNDKRVELNDYATKEVESVTVESIEKGIIE